MRRPHPLRPRIGVHPTVYVTALGLAVATLSFGVIDTTVKRRLGPVFQSLKSLERRMDSLATIVQRLDRKIDRLDTRVDKIDRRLTLVEASLSLRTSAHHLGLRA